MDHWDNIWKLILSLAGLAKSQERSDDSSIVNNYYFVNKETGACSGSFLLLHLYYRSTHVWKKCLAPWIVRVVPTTASCSRFVPSCVSSIGFGGKKILFILVVWNWASNQHNTALLCESLSLSLQVISLYSVVIHPMNPHIVLPASMRCLL